nr:MAG TPA: hypothetical protein [Caudoviricetes sp.]
MWRSETNTPKSPLGMMTPARQTSAPPPLPPLALPRRHLPPVEDEAVPGRWQSDSRGYYSVRHGRRPGGQVEGAL